MSHVSRNLDRTTPDHILQITPRTLKKPDFKFVLLPIHSSLPSHHYNPNRKHLSPKQRILITLRRDFTQRAFELLTLYMSAFGSNLL